MPVMFERPVSFRTSAKVNEGDEGNEEMNDKEYAFKNRNCFNLSNCLLFLQFPSFFSSFFPLF
jgi:hypothetical protein